MRENDFQKQLAKLRRDKKLLWLGVLFFVLVTMWILLGIFTTSKTSTIDPALRELAKPFVPRLESRVFDEIIQKKVFDEGELGYFPIYVFDENNSSVGQATLLDIMSDNTSQNNILLEEDDRENDDAETINNNESRNIENSPGTGFLPIPAEVILNGPSQ